MLTFNIYVQEQNHNWTQMQKQSKYNFICKIC